MIIELVDKSHAFINTIYIHLGRPKKELPILHPHAVHKVKGTRRSVTNYKYLAN